ncbi:hypothetical protein M501DRAFT_981360 [Patellaria atrata CBS 101060]|uniref:HNH domain-containing protein n=1 Tax=Patellaria atrata CBS 101060 TaxID=1346257 RepID=A0A9P4VPX9_9PEZI|nr:hypothetical protein M501DRAFT_981360 [Patellaria atrata CBS 101060]
MISPEEEANYDIFRDCLSNLVMRKLAVPERSPRKKRGPKGRKAPDAPVEHVRETRQETEIADDLGDFIDYLASEIFPSLPLDLRTLSYSSIKADSALSTKYSDPFPQSTIDSILNPLPPSVTDSLISYGFLDDHPSSLSQLLAPIFIAYIEASAAAPPVWSSTRASACEICDRDWIPLTYHHLIPRSTHERVMKRGWHKEWELEKVAWLCRACHSFVHRAVGNEELAREFYSVEKLLGREDVKGFAGWVRRVRWKSR